MATFCSMWSIATRGRGGLRAGVNYGGGGGPARRARPHVSPLTLVPNGLLEKTGGEPDLPKLRVELLF